MVEILINPKFFGPSILELDPVLVDVQGIVEVKWHGTKEERAVLHKHEDRSFRLMVTDLPAMERAATALGLPLKFETALLTAALTSLTSRKAYNWRNFVSEEFNPVIARSIVTRLAAGAVRKGMTPSLALIASECLIDGVNAVDADVLLRLRELQKRHGTS